MAAYVVGLKEDRAASPVISNSMEPTRMVRVSPREPIREIDMLSG